MKNKKTTAPRRRLRPARLAALVLFMASIGTLLWAGSRPDTYTANANHPAAAPANRAPAAMTNPATARATGNTPPDVPEDEWHQVVAAMHATPNGDKELPRLAEYLTFQHRVALWQQSKKSGAGSSDRAELARYLLDALPSHVSRAELTGIEAHTLASEILQDSVGGSVQLQQAMQQEDARLSAAEPQADSRTAARQQASLSAYKKRESEITAQWMAMAPAQRDPKWLQSQLDTARQQAFDGTAGTE